jgi:hypothetical protein
MVLRGKRYPVALCLTALLRYSYWRGHGNLLRAVTAQALTWVGWADTATLRRRYPDYRVLLALPRESPSHQVRLGGRGTSTTLAVSMTTGSSGVAAARAGESAAPHATPLVSVKGKPIRWYYMSVSLALAPL